MKWIQSKDYDYLSELAIQIFEKQLKDNPSSVLGFATGSTPIGFYKKLVKRYQQGIISFKHVKTFNLDEYVGLDPKNITSYSYYMKKYLFQYIDIPPENVHIPNGKEDLEESIKQYEKQIEEVGGIDLLLLGIGVNGHIGFNEPGTSFHAKTHITKLTETTIKANQKFFPNPSDMPTHAITMGIDTILKARKIVLLLSGKTKQTAYEYLRKGEITEDFPASALHNHPDVTVIYAGVE